jgi:hypothetical protein
MGRLISIVEARKRARFAAVAAGDDSVLDEIVEAFGMLLTHLVVPRIHRMMVREIQEQCDAISRWEDDGGA